MRSLALKSRNVYIKTMVFDDAIDDLCAAEVLATVRPNNDPMDYYNYRDSIPDVEILAVCDDEQNDLVLCGDNLEKVRNEVLDRYYELHRIEQETIEEAMEESRNFAFSMLPF